jgi:hypothetical protein
VFLKESLLPKSRASGTHSRPQFIFTRKYTTMRYSNFVIRSVSQLPHQEFYNPSIKFINALSNLNTRNYCNSR